MLLSKFSPTSLLIIPVYQLLSVGSLPAGPSVTYCFLYWWRLLLKTKTESVPDSKQSRRASTLLFEVDMFAESKLPPAWQRQTWQTTQTHCVMFPLGMSNANRSVVRACGYNALKWIRWGSAQVKLRPDTKISSSDMLLNPIAQLVESCKEMSPHIGLTAGITPDPALP